MVICGQERKWKIDKTEEHFIVMELNMNSCRVEYIPHGRIEDLSIISVEKESMICSDSIFQHATCSEITKFITGRRWLYNHRCRMCQWKANGCTYM